MFITCNLMCGFGPSAEMPRIKSSAHTWQPEPQGSVGCVLWAVQLPESVERGLKGPDGELRPVQGMQPELVGRELEVKWAKEWTHFSNLGMTASEVVGLK